MLFFSFRVDVLLPFGWSWSPVLAQLFIFAALLPLCGLDDLHHSQYLDDILLASTDPHFLHAMFLYARHLLTNADFLIFPKPSQWIQWLGKPEVR